MPSPFPGMDPYLEDPARWPGIHQGLITYIRDALQPALAPRYVAVIGERLMVEESGRSIIPDVFVRSGSVREVAATEYAAPDCDAAVLVEVPFYPREVFIEIVDPRSNQRVITVIEVLSPSNKSRGTNARAQYLQKQDEVLESRANLVEIDLLRAGLPTAAVFRSGIAHVPPHDYLIAVSRAERRAQHELYPVMLRDRLPRVAIPLARADRDIALDLQAVFDRCYDNGAYAAQIDYHEPPLPPFESEADKAWAEELLRHKGIRG